MAYVIKPLTSVVKLWRTIYNDSGSVIYADGPNSPAISGFVAYTGKAGAAGQMRVRVYSPLWRLRTRFHVNNHFLSINQETGNPYTESELIWKFIDLLQNAFGPAGPTEQMRSYMGMEKGNFMWASDPIMAPYFQAKGASGWANIFDSILSRADSPELIPRYYHADGSPIQMYLDTNKARGSDKTASVHFRYRTGANDNLDDLTEDIEIQPGEFANYLWTVGQGGPNSGKLALAENIDDDQYGYNTVKVYQHLVHVNDVQTFDDNLQKMAEGELFKVRKPPATYNMVISPAASITTTPQYGKDYVCGDAVSLSGSKGALSISNVKQRIFECTLRMSENNVETSIPLIGDDVKEHIISS
jgi:hypothetical protein